MPGTAFINGQTCNSIILQVSVWYLSRRKYENRMPEKIDLWPYLSVQSILNWTSNQNPSMFAAIWILKRWLHGRLTSVCAIYLERGTDRGASGTRFTSWPRASLWPSSCHGPSYSLLHQVCPWWYAPVDSSSPPATEEEVSSTLLRDVLCPKYADFFASHNSLLAAFLVVIHFPSFSQIYEKLLSQDPTEYTKVMTFANRMSRV